jgi:hypothetical protein
MRKDIKQITVRIPLALYRRLHDVAVAQSVSLNTLAVRALEAYVAKASVESSTADQDRLPLRELGALSTPIAEAADLTEEELLDHARRVRRRIWQERYEKAVRAAVD